MTFKIHRITALFITVLASSCAHYYYVANVQNVPLFREKNEVRLSGTFGMGDESYCTEVQAAYSITGNLGIMANYMRANGGDRSYNYQNDWARGNYFDGAIGYFKPYSNSGVFEIYGGVGVCNQHHQYTNGILSYTYSGTSDLSFTKLFVQPSFGFTFKIFDIAASTRICRLYFNNVDNNISRQVNQYDFDELNTIAMKKNYLFLEPAFTIRGGWKYMKVQFQASYANVFNKTDLFFVEQPHLSIGLYIAIAGRYR